MKKLIFFSTLLWISLLAFANDTAGTTAAGGINFVKTPSITMEREELTISPNNVKVSYVFKNNTDKDITTQVFFPLPPYRMEGVNASWDNEISSNTKDAPFGNFSVFVQGQPMNYNTNIRAMLNGKDITQTLLQSGIPLNPDLVAGNIPLQDQAKINQWQAKARELGFLDDAGKPKWQKQIIFYWTQTFPANQEVLVEHQYKPAAGAFYAGITPGKDLNNLINENEQRIASVFNLKLENLIGKDNFKNWLVQRIEQNPNHQGGIYAYFYNINYILLTGANWGGPIKNFSLDILKSADAAIAYNTFYGKRTAMTNKDNPDHIIIFLKNFTPQKNLQVLYGTSSPV